MPSPEQKKKLLKAKIAVALHDELGRVPKTEEIDQVFLLSRVMYKAILGLHYKRQEQKKNGQMAIFDRVPEQLNVSFHWHILAIESKRLPRYEVQVEGKRWTISHGFAVTIKTAVTMANAVLTT
jgi:hypothetical protein